MRLVLEAVRGCLVGGEWRNPGDAFTLPAVPDHIEEARRLVRKGFAIPANLSTRQRLGDCRTPKERSIDSLPAPGASTG